VARPNPAAILEKHRSHQRELRNELLEARKGLAEELDRLESDIDAIDRALSEMGISPPGQRGGQRSRGGGDAGGERSSGGGGTRVRVPGGIPHQILLTLSEYQDPLSIGDIHESIMQRTGLEPSKASVSQSLHTLKNDKAVKTESRGQYVITSKGMKQVQEEAPA